VDQLQLLKANQMAPKRYDPYTLKGKPTGPHQVALILEPQIHPHRPESKRHRWLPDCMEESRPVRTKALYPIFAGRRTRTGSVLKQFAGKGLT